MLFRSLRLLIFGGSIFAISGYFSYVEAVYLVQGASARAAVTKVSEVTVRNRSSTSKRWQVEYVFAEPNGAQRSGSDTQHIDWKRPSDGKLLVQYTPGVDGRCRIDGKVNWVPLGLFGGCLAVLAFFGFLFWLQTQEATRRANEGKLRDLVDDDSFEARPMPGTSQGSFAQR